MLGWVSAALAQEVELGVGRAAVLRPHLPPTEVVVAHPDLVEVLPVAPALVLVGRKPGRTTVAVEHDGQRVEWAVTVQQSGAVAPSGTLVDPPGDVLSLAPGDGAWCRVAGTRATMLLDTCTALVQPVGYERTFVQAQAPGVADLVIETSRGPKVVTLAVGEQGPDRLPDGCHRPGEVVSLTVGDTLEVPVGKKVALVVVGRPEVVAAVAAATPGTLALTGLQSGRTTVLVRSREDEDPWARTVVVASRR